MLPVFDAAPTVSNFVRRGGEGGLTLLKGVEAEAKPANLDAADAKAAIVRSPSPRGLCFCISRLCIAPLQRPPKGRRRRRRKRKRRRSSRRRRRRWSLLSRDCRACISWPRSWSQVRWLAFMQVKPRRFRETARELNRRSGSGGSEAEAARPSRALFGFRPKSGPARWAETSLELPKTVTAGAIKPARCVRRAVAITAPRPARCAFSQSL